MSCRRVTITIATLLVGSALAAAPAGAASGPLLSGYGGPGEGEQAILGSALIGGPATPPAPGAASASGELARAVAGSAASESSSAGTASGGGAAAGSARRRDEQGAATSGARRSRRGGAVGARRGAEASLTATESTPPLGITGADLAYVLVAFAALALTGVLTLRLAGRPGRR